MCVGSVERDYLGTFKRLQNCMEFTYDLHTYFISWVYSTKINGV